MNALRILVIVAVVAVVTVSPGRAQEPKTPKAEAPKVPLGFERVEMKLDKTGVGVSFLARQGGGKIDIPIDSPFIRRIGNELTKIGRWQLMLRDIDPENGKKFPKTPMEAYEAMKQSSKIFEVSKPKVIKLGEYEGIEFISELREKKNWATKTRIYLVKGTLVSVTITGRLEDDPATVQTMLDSLAIEISEPKPLAKISIMVPTDKWELIAHEKSGLSFRYPGKPKSIQESPNLFIVRGVFDPFSVQCNYNQSKVIMEIHKQVYQEQLKQLKMRPPGERELSDAEFAGFKGTLWKTTIMDRPQGMQFRGLKESATLQLSADLTRVSEEEAMFFFKSVMQK